MLPREVMGASPPAESNRITIAAKCTQIEIINALVKADDSNFVV
jgi:hypothetical protein